MLIDIPKPICATSNARKGDTIGVSPILRPIALIRVMEKLAKITTGIIPRKGWM